MFKEKKSTILLVDDEPQHLDWLSDYLVSKGYEVENVTNVRDAEKQLREYRYRAVVVDLNIPAPDDYEAKLREKGEVFVTYKGLYIADLARNLGHRNRQVIIYSVHEVSEVANYAEKISCVYLSKGRPRKFKMEIDDVLSYDPTSDPSSN